jgi:hypothetical protein
VQMARQLCAGVAAAHDCGVVHRDLQPASMATATCASRTLASPRPSAQWVCAFVASRARQPLFGSWLDDRTPARA